MLLRAERLAGHLERTLAPAYLLSGDEPLLIQEAADAIRTSARAAGFADRLVFDADDKQFDWQRLLMEANSPSLFADRRMLEVRLPSGKPGDAGSKALQTYCETCATANLLLVITPRLDRATQNSRWWKALAGLGAVVQAWPVTAAEMPQWLRQRLQRAGIRASAEAIAILADRVEGNLLAAMQEVEKLQLLAPDGEVDGATMSVLVTDSARYDVFAFTDHVLDGDARAALQTLRGLRAEGTDAGVLLWALARELRVLAQARAEQAGDAAALDRLEVWDKRKPLFRKALRRLSSARLARLLRQAGAIDRAIKGLRQAPVWDELTALALGIAGADCLAPASLRTLLQQARSH